MRRESALLIVFLMTTAAIFGAAAYVQMDVKELKVRVDRMEPFRGLSGFLKDDDRGRTWFFPVPIVDTLGACDSVDDCEDEVDTLCDDAGFDGAQEGMSEITVHENGDRTCSGPCSGGCNDNGCPTAMISCG